MFLSLSIDFLFVIMEFSSFSRCSNVLTLFTANSDQTNTFIHTSPHAGRSTPFSESSSVELPGSGLESGTRRRVTHHSSSVVKSALHTCADSNTNENPGEKLHLHARAMILAPSTKEKLTLIQDSSSPSTSVGRAFHVRVLLLGPTAKIGELNYARTYVDE